MLNTFPSLLQKFSHPIKDIELPSAFTYPFYYQPHPLSLMAAKELQARISTDQNLQGRMYGVLIVQDNHGDLGYLTAVSGTTTELDKQLKLDEVFVPPIFKGFEKESFFTRGQAEVNILNNQISMLKADPLYHHYRLIVDSEKQAAEFQITQFQKLMVTHRQLRKSRREQLKEKLTQEHQQTHLDEFQQATTQSIQLSRESVEDKKTLAELKSYWQIRLSKAQQQFDEKHQQIEQLTSTRSKLSNKLQKLLFKQYQFLNISGETKHLLDVFRSTSNIKPPAGSGDCAAPKLLQYAFEHQLTPICMAEFWWGAPARSEIRKHGNFYPACQGKCQPILAHMLCGMEVDTNPLLQQPIPLSELAIIYQDEHLVVVNKPAELLSVPGKNIQDSVYTRIKTMFPQATGSLIVHRLDMATSGLLMLALNPRAHKNLQQQFINKEVSKRYIAVIDGILKETTGRIQLPLLTDINDRPRQLVCDLNGKYAETLWQVIEYKNNQTRVMLTPITGRTHQLRVHCAHSKGLNMPIIGDGLYGASANRLHLHAQNLSFKHPITKELLNFEVNCDF